MPCFVLQPGIPAPLQEGIFWLNAPNAMKPERATTGEGSDEDELGMAHADLSVRRALEDNRIVPYYYTVQPLETEARITGVEGLARGITEDRREVLPAVLIPAAKREGLMWEVHMRIAEMTCAFAKQQGLTAGINVEPSVLGHPEFAEALLDIIERTGIDPSRVTVEFLEGTTKGQLHKARRSLQTLFRGEKRGGGRIAGIRGAVDDAPTEHSMDTVLPILEKLGHADVVKVNWPEVRELAAPDRITRGRAGKKIGKVVEKARRSGADEIVFEGVEPGEDALRQALKALVPEDAWQVLQVQVGKPLPAEEMRRVLLGERGLEPHTVLRNGRNGHASGNGHGIVLGNGKH